MARFLPLSAPVEKVRSFFLCSERRTEARLVSGGIATELMSKFKTCLLKR